MWRGFRKSWDVGRVGGVLVVVVATVSYNDVGERVVKISVRFCRRTRGVKLQWSPGAAES